MALLPARLLGRRSELGFEDGDPSSNKYVQRWANQQRRNPPAPNRSTTSVVGSTSEALFDPSAALSSDAIFHPASKLPLSDAGRLHRQFFFLRASDPNKLALLGPCRRRRLEGRNQSLASRDLLVEEGSAGALRLVHAQKSVGKIPMRTEVMPVDARMERRSSPLAESHPAQWQSTRTTDLKTANPRDMQVIAQRVYELIVDRIRREKERLGR
jgi:hypothetical protein